MKKSAKVWLLAALTFVLLSVTACVSMSESDYEKAIQDAYNEGYRTAESEWEDRVNDFYNEGYADGWNDKEDEVADIWAEAEREYAEAYDQGQIDLADRMAAGSRLWDIEDWKSEMESGFVTIDDLLEEYGRIAGIICEIVY
jgi:hypothetical protein